MSDTQSGGVLSPEQVVAGQRPLVALREGLARVIFGQDELLDLVVIALAARGHVLFEGLPGLGKTELVKALGRLLHLQFSRVQFTPDLLPGDVTGGPVLEERDGQRRFVFQPGPLFSNLVLADEINRASPKTQAALLEAMQERRVTSMGHSHALPDPFFVLATQNPIELEGTYPLPEAQLDRFLFKVEVPPVDEDVLMRILTERQWGQPPEQVAVLDATAVQAMFDAVGSIYLPKPVASYIARLVAATRPDGEGCPPSLREVLRFGASPRAAIAMAESARAAALLAGRPNADFDDVRRVVLPVLGHRLVLHHGARLEGVDAAEAVRRLLEGVPELVRELPGEMR